MGAGERADPGGDGAKELIDAPHHLGRRGPRPHRDRTQKQDLDERFQAELDLALQAILERPTSFPEVARGVRRAQLDRFPHLVFFRQDQDADAIVVFAVIHGSRHHKVWRRRT